MNARKIVLCAGLAACCAAGSAMGDKPKLQVDQPLLKAPIGFARAVMSADGTVTRVGDVIPYSGGSSRTNYDISYDAFEPDSSGFPTDGAANGGYDPECFGGVGSRYGYNSTYMNTFSADDMEVAPGHAGTQSERVEWGWKNGAFEENLIIAIFTAEEFSDDCAGFDTDGDGISDSGADGFFDGVLYIFGPTDPTPAGFYWYSDVDLVGSGLFHEMPADGIGSVVMQGLADDDFDDVPDRFATSTNWQLHSTERIGNDSHSTGLVWDDDFDPDTGENLSNGTHEAPDECYDTTGGVSCPDPLTNMVCFWGGPVSSCYADCDDNGTVNTLDFLCFLNHFSNGDPAADCDENGTINTLDFLCFLNAFNDGCP